MLLSPAPRVILIDNDPRDLATLADALSQCNVSYRSVLYPDDIETIHPNPHVRILFFDFNLGEGNLGADIDRHYDVIAVLIREHIKPAGPYFIVLWTIHDERADGLRVYLNENLSECAKPFAVLPLKKTNHLLAPADDESGRKDLIVEIEAKIADTPEIAALLAWETKVMEATGETVSDVAGLAQRADKHGQVSEGLSRLLLTLAEEAVGKDNVEQGRFRAVNRALVPVLADRMSTLGTGAEQQGDTQFRTLWRRALCRGSGGELPREVVALLNGVSLMAAGKEEHPSRRGVVIQLRDIFDLEKFEGRFDMEQSLAAEKQFGCPHFRELEEVQRRWVLIQVQAACDEAQRRPGPVPFCLGLEFPAGRKRKGKMPAACWESPIFRLAGDAADKNLHVNVRFGVFLPPEKLGTVEPTYRLREPLLGSLSHHIHSYGARPGIISFR